eukprot:6463476-Amphidinium_carterae.1
MLLEHLVNLPPAAILTAMVRLTGWRGGSSSLSMLHPSSCSWTDHMTGTSGTPMEVRNLLQTKAAVGCRGRRIVSAERAPIWLIAHVSLVVGGSPCS